MARRASRTVGPELRRRREQLRERAVRRIESGRSFGAATLRRIGDAQAVSQALRKREQRGKPQPESDGTGGAKAPDVSQGPSFRQADPEDRAVRREGNFLRALIRVRENPDKPVSDRTRRRLEAGFGKGGRKDPLAGGVSVEIARALKDEEVGRLQAEFRKRREKIKRRGTIYDRL